MNELAFLVAFILKPGVLLLTILALRVLWKGRRVPGSRIFSSAFLLFMAGELFCAVDVYYRQRMTLVNEGMHDVLMVASFSVLIVGFYRFAGENYRCWNYCCDSYRNCRMHPADCPDGSRHGSFLGWLLIGVALIGLLPAFAPVRGLQRAMPAGFGGTVFGTYLYDRTLLLSYLQQLIFPILGTASLLISATVYLVRKGMGRMVLWLASLGIGLLSFSFARLVLACSFHPEAALLTFWEELLEALLFLIFVIWFRDSVRALQEDPSVRYNSR